MSPHWEQSITSAKELPGGKKEITFGPRKKIEKPPAPEELRLIKTAPSHSGALEGKRNPEPLRPRGLDKYEGRERRQPPDKGRFKRHGRPMDGGGLKEIRER